jgi:chromatin structure-remodeling complex subunit RSC1/2
VHAVVAELKNTTPISAPTIPTRTTTPAGQVTSSTVQQQHASDPDVDVITPDSDGPEDDGPAAQTDRDPQSDEIIKHLEKGLPSWPGFGEEGWMDEVKPVSCWRCLLFPFNGL